MENKGNHNGLMKKRESKVVKKEEKKEEKPVVDLMNPPFDPDIPEQKQRHFR